MELSNLKALTPEMVLVGTGALALLVGLAKQDRVRRLVQWIALAGLLAGFIITLFGGDAMLAQDGKFILAPYANYITLLVCGIGFLSVLAAWDLPAKNDPTVCDSQYRGEFFSLLLFSLAGVSMVAKVNDLIWLFVVLELVSIPTYIMVATSRSQPIAQEAGVKYFFLGALAAAVYLFGFSYLYGYAGSTRFVDIAAKFAVDMGPTGTLPMLGLIGLLMVIVGVAYKIAAVPLHFYTPDVYQGAATPVTAFLAFAPKAAGMVAIIAVVGLTGFHWNALPLGGVHNGHLSSAQTLQILLTVMSVLTMTVGNVLALLQRNVKRMLAYSSIAHSGYMLVGLVAGPGTGAGDGIHATLFYLGAYAIMNLGAFAVLVYFQGKSDTGEELDDLAGIAKEHPAAAFALAICFLSLIGMPLTIGFWGKFYLIQAALMNGHSILAVIMVLNAAVAAAYYLRVIAALYLRDPWSPFTVRTTLAPRLAATVCTVGVIFFGVMPTPLLVSSMTSTAARMTTVAPPLTTPPVVATNVTGGLAQAK